jgi:hypothetical protein
MDGTDILVYAYRDSESLGLIHEMRMSESIPKTAGTAVLKITSGKIKNGNI